MHLRRPWPDGPLWRDAAALAAGLAAPLAFAPFRLYPLCFVSLCILYAVWLEASVARAWWRGFLFGLGMFGVGVTWIYVSIHTYGHVGAPVTVLITVVFVGVLSLFPALAGFAATRLRGGANSPAVALLLLFPSCWVACEWIRGWFLTGFPWLNFGYSQIDSPLSGLAPLLGVYGVSLAAAWSAGVLWYVVKSPAWRRRAAALAALAAVWLAVGLLGTVGWTHPVGDPLRVSLIQGDLPQDIKWQPDMRGPTLDLYEHLTREHWDSDLIVWPETAIPAFLQEVRPDVDRLARKAREHGAALMTGLVVMEEGTRRYYNSLMEIGTHTAFYYKHHLVPFTEYLPMSDVLGDVVKILHVPMSNFSAGPARQPLMRVKGNKVAVSICYEDAFGEEIIRSLPAASLLVNISNDAWFGGSIALPQHLQIARMRALETGRPMLRDTNTGITAFIAPDGRVRASLPQFEADVLTARVQPMGGATPYVVTGNLPVLAVVAVMLVGGIIAGYRSRRVTTAAGRAG